jgi:hypothetical protein
MIGAIDTFTTEAEAKQGFIRIPLGHPSPTGTAEAFGLAGESMSSDQGISRSYNEILVMKYW